MTGWQFLDRRRSDRSLGQIPVVLVSGLASAVAERHRDDVAAILEKPLDEQQLAATLHRLLGDGLAPRERDKVAGDAARPLILVVEDDEDTRASVCELLEDHGYRIARARNGQEAETYLRSTRPDCIILDLWMPVMDGWRFTSRLQQLDQRLPIVVITAAESYWGYPVPLAQVMRKPVHADTLMAILTKLLPPAVQGLRPAAGPRARRPRRGRGRG